ncbi:MAG: DUF3087 family protein [Gammaproteobacteria bacterium]|nr:DUF3087 family protein [Gammaproteobacteria bacterium]
MNFHYKGSRQLYELDDNTITLEDLLKEEATFQEQVAAKGFSV